MIAAAHPQAQACDCSQQHMVSKKFYDIHGRVTAVGWRCTVCDARYLVPPARASLLRRLWAWVMAPIIH